MDGETILTLLAEAAQTGILPPPDREREIRAAGEQSRTLPAESLLPGLTSLLCRQAAAEVLRSYAEVLAVWIPELVPTFGFCQHNPHHDRDVWEHTLGVVEAAPPEPVLRWAALLHDVGKPACFAILEDGLGHFYGHAQLSQQLAEQILSRLGMAEAQRLQIGTLIRYHDFPIPPERKRLEKLVRKHGAETVRQLIALHIADTRGQSMLCASRIEEYEQVAKLLEALLAEAEEPVFQLAVNGYDAQALGLRGREIGQALRACREAVEQGTLPNEREVLIRYLKSSL